MSTEQTASATEPVAERGFCSRLHAIGHIFVDMASDYYRIGDGLPQYEQSDPRAWVENGD